MGCLSGDAICRGLTVQAGVRHDIASLAVEGRADAQTQATHGQQGVTSSIALASLVPCGHVSILVACALAGVGSLAARGVVSHPGQDHAFFADAGVRLGIEVPFGTRFFARAHASIGLAALTRVTYQLDGQDVWSTPALSASLGIALGASL